MPPANDAEDADNDWTVPEGPSTRALDRTRRAPVLQRFAARQCARKNWVSWTAIADWCAREDGSIVPNETKREEAYRQLLVALYAGEFEHKGKDQVLLLHPESPPSRMTRVQAADHLRSFGEAARTYWEHCWIPSRMTRPWFEKRQLRLPLHLLPVVGTAPVPAADSGISATAAAPQKNRGGRPPRYDWDAFDREIVRIANTVDGLPVRPALQRQMLAWCHHGWGDNTPAESVVRDRIAKLYPA